MGWLMDGLKSVIDEIADKVTDGVAAIGNAISGGELEKNIHNQAELESVKDGLGIQDLTGANEEYKVGETPGTTAPSSGDNWQKYVDQVEEWRQQDFARDDTKFQRQIQDMRAAGINPNLALGALSGSSASGTSITAPPNTELEAELNEKLTLMEQYIDNEFKADENQKDRLTDLIGGIVNIFLAKKLFK